MRLPRLTVTRTVLRVVNRVLSVSRRPRRLADVSRTVGRAGTTRGGAVGAGVAVGVGVAAGVITGTGVCVGVGVGVGSGSVWGYAGSCARSPT